MPRVNTVQHAAKDYPEDGIQKGDTYYWWKFRFGGMHRSKTRPKPSQLTQSPFLIVINEVQEELSSLNASDFSDGEDIQAKLQELADRVREVGEEAQSSFDNIPEGLQQGSTGEMLQNRADETESMACELESIDTDVDVEGIRDSVMDEIHQSDVYDWREEAEKEWDALSDGERAGKEKDKWVQEKTIAKHGAMVSEVVEDRTRDRIQEIIDEAQGVSYNGE